MTPAAGLTGLVSVFETAPGQSEEIVLVYPGAKLHAENAMAAQDLILCKAHHADSQQQCTLMLCWIDVQ